MTAKQLHKLTGKLIAQKRGDAEVAVDTSTFLEHDDSTIHVIEAGKYRRLQGADDSGPTGGKFPFLVLSGGTVVFRN